PGGSKSDQATSKVEKRQVILRLFLPANEQAAKAIHPGMRSFHHPPPCLEAGLSLDGLGLFPSRADMGGKAELAQDVAHLVVIIPFVQTHSLRVFFAWLWTCDDDAF